MICLLVLNMIQNTFISIHVFERILNQFHMLAWFRLFMCQYIAVWRFICKLALVLCHCGTDLFDLPLFTLLYCIRFVAIVLLIELNECTPSVVYFERLALLQDIMFILELTETCTKTKSRIRGYRANGCCH